MSSSQYKDERENTAQKKERIKMLRKDKKHTETATRFYRCF